MAGYVIIAYIASVVIQFATAISLYGVAAYVAGDSNPFVLSELLQSFFAFLPALWIMIGFTILVVGLIPKATVIVWAYFGIVTFTSFIGRLVFTGNLEFLMNITPLHFVSQPEPLKDYVINYTPLIIMTAIAAAMTIGGIVSFRKRDMVW
jgi:ABC-2 type transport system permease protein